MADVVGGGRSSSLGRKAQPRRTMPAESGSDDSGWIFGEGFDPGESTSSGDQQAAQGVGREHELSAAERYLAGGLALHFHARERRPKSFVESDSREFCALIYALGNPAPRGLRWVADQIPLAVDGCGSEPDPRCIDVDSARVNDAVLVNVPEAVEMPNAFRGVPSLVRLQRLQDCGGVFVQKRQDLMSLESAGVASDRKGNLPGGAWLPEFLDRVRAACQKPSRLVESGARVVDNIADHEPHSESSLSRAGIRTKAEDVAAGLVIELSDDTKRLRLKESLALNVESFQLLDCPIELCSWPEKLHAAR